MRRMSLKTVHGLVIPLPLALEVRVVGVNQLQGLQGLGRSVGHTRGIVHVMLQVQQIVAASSHVLGILREAVQLDRSVVMPGDGVTT